MASELINKYYDDIVVNKNEFTTEIHDALWRLCDKPAALRARRIRRRRSPRYYGRRLRDLLAFTS